MPIWAHHNILELFSNFYGLCNLKTPHVTFLKLANTDIQRQCNHTKIQVGFPLSTCALKAVPDFGNNWRQHARSFGHSDSPGQCHGICHIREQNNHECEPGYKKIFFSSESLIKKGAVLNSLITKIFLIQSLQQ